MAPRTRHRRHATRRGAADRTTGEIRRRQAHLLACAAGDRADSPDGPTQPGANGAPAPGEPGAGAFGRTGSEARGETGQPIPDNRLWYPTRAEPVEVRTAGPAPS
ncbi:hypothetical protein GCM10022220_62740 [Actinocatenispora rupis]|uniref:Uncharacterized protein n=1 Tax=Actinocatenispora rupis TaxID=519421 RepID=A0A8J3NH25_9ACTN|nr:hypothetical protein Aru02nite_63980 [Actinocatenispora rupis]